MEEKCDERLIQNWDDFVSEILKLQIRPVFPESYCTRQKHFSKAIPLCHNSQNPGPIMVVNEYDVVIPNNFLLLFFLIKKVGKKIKACEVGSLNVLELRPERF